MSTYEMIANKEAVLTEYDLDHETVGKLVLDEGVSIAEVAELYHTEASEVEFELKIDQLIRNNVKSVTVHEAMRLLSDASGSVGCSTVFNMKALRV